MEHLTINAVILMITLSTVDEGIQQIVAPMETLGNCYKVAGILSNDEKKSLEAEKLLRDKGKDIEDRTLLLKAGCAVVKIPLQGMQAKR